VQFNDDVIFHMKTSFQGLEHLRELRNNWGKNKKSLHDRFGFDRVSSQVRP
jgi:hypothetical protein